MQQHNNGEDLIRICKCGAPVDTNTGTTCRDCRIGSLLKRPKVKKPGKHQYPRV